MKKILAVSFLMSSLFFIGSDFRTDFAKLTQQQEKLVQAQANSVWYATVSVGLMTPFLAFSKVGRGLLAVPIAVCVYKNIKRDQEFASLEKQKEKMCLGK